MIDLTKQNKLSKSNISLVKVTYNDINLHLNLLKLNDLQEGTNNLVKGRCASYDGLMGILQVYQPSIVQQLIHKPVLLMFYSLNQCKVRDTAGVTFLALSSLRLAIYYSLHSLINQTFSHTSKMQI